ncbi:MAG: hypothetical protein K5668_10605 [Lachnospiraceae bacterium]|nr:hypothetical protein [Lachnospiraceae bacterium]
MSLSWRQHWLQDAATRTSDTSSGADQTDSAADNTEADPAEGGTEEKDAVEPARIAGHYDLWTYAAGGEYSVEIPHDELGMTGFVFLEEDHTGKMGQSVSGTKTANNDITWDENGNISVFGNNLYTFEVQGDVLIVDQGGGRSKVLLCTRRCGRCNGI